MHDGARPGRYGLLFARLGMGVHGEAVGSAKFIQESGAGAARACPSPAAGFATATIRPPMGDGSDTADMADSICWPIRTPESSLPSSAVLEDRHAYTEEYLPGVVRMAEDIIRLYGRLMPKPSAGDRRKGCPMVGP